MKIYGNQIDGTAHRSDDPAITAAWKKDNERIIKTDIKEQLAKACGFGILLIEHWGKNRMRPEAVDFFESCILCYEHELMGHFLSGSVLDDWLANDWRGQKKQAPTPTQVFERALMLKAKLREEAEADKYRMVEQLRPKQVEEF